jgi:hypothetical protein
MPSTRLTDCSPWLATAWLEIHEQYVQEHPGHDLDIRCTYRSPEEQFALFCKGRTLVDGAWVNDSDPSTSIVTNCDGVKLVSKHNVRPSSAIDFAVVLPGGKISWDPREYEPVGKLAEMRNLVWGGRWSHLKDYGHVELAP